MLLLCKVLGTLVMAVRRVDQHSQGIASYGLFRSTPKAQSRTSKLPSPVSSEGDRLAEEDFEAMNFIPAGTLSLGLVSQGFVKPTLESMLLGPDCC